MIIGKEIVEFGYWLVNQEHKYNRNYSKEQVENYYRFFLEEKVERLKGKPYDFEKTKYNERTRKM